MAIISCPSNISLELNAVISTVAGPIDTRYFVDSFGFGIIETHVYWFRWTTYVEQSAYILLRRMGFGIWAYLAITTNVAFVSRWLISDKLESVLSKKKKTEKRFKVGHYKWEKIV
jgi:hypothetical protein